ncbi:cell division protein FtsQ/DivIB [Citricoccus alkalitolerans]|uniref:Cell division protein FtsQ/DivIB n=1 Tax=Citricoccus alkalitolerans TaxID=246603 RepID=A0ABV8XW85_9MICC
MTDERTTGNGAGSSASSDSSVSEDTVRPADNVVEFPETEGQVRRRHRRLWLLGGAGALVLLGILGAVLYFSPVLAIQQLKVTGTDLLERSHAEELLEPVIGVPLPQVGQRTVEDLVAGEPAVDTVRVHAEPPNSLSVEIVEHQPVAMVPEGEGHVLYSEHGEALATLSEERASTYRLPSVSSAEDVSDPEVFDAITSVLGTLPEPIRTRMESATAETVDSVTLQLTDGRTVLWGNADKGARKAQVLEALLNVPGNEEAPIQEFDVSTPDRPVTR